MRKNIMNLRIVALALAVAALFGCGHPSHGPLGVYFPSQSSDGGGGGGGTVLPDAGTGGIWFETDSGAVKGLAIGANGTYLGAAGGLPAWSFVDAGTSGTVLPDAGYGGIWYQGDAGAPIALPVGSNGNLLQISNGIPIYAQVGTGVVGNVVIPPVNASWSQVNFLTASTTSANSGSIGLPTVFLNDIYGGGSGQPVRGLSIARTGSVGTSYTLSAAIIPLLPIASTPEVGIFISDGTKLITFANGSTSGNNINEVKTYATVSASPSNLYSANSTFGENGYIWYQIKSDTTHRTYSVSTDGYNYLARYTETISGSTLVNTETVFGFYTAPVNTSGAGITLASWNATDP
jgi:hypothetical protein